MLNRLVIIGAGGHGKVVADIEFSGNLGRREAAGIDGNFAHGAVAGNSGVVSAVFYSQLFQSGAGVNLYAGLDADSEGIYSGIVQQGNIAAAQRRIGGAVSDIFHG